MHRCLSIPEIVRLICDEVDTENQEERSKCTIRMAQLFALALTCRGFRQPALACLWEEISDFAPIVKCLGKDMWVLKPTGIKIQPEHLHFSRPLSPSNIATIAKYGRLVRTFAYPAFDRLCLVDTKVYDALQLAFNGTTLFSNVRVLAILTRDITDYIGLFSTQSLTCTLTSSIMLSPEYPALSPNITSVHLKLFDYGDTIAALSSHWSNLSQFRVNAITYEVLHLLSQYSDLLRVLQFGGIKTDNSDWPESTVGTDTLVFHALETLAPCFDNTLRAVQFFSCLSADNRLSTLEILLDDKESNGERVWLEVLGCIMKYTRCLEQLYIRDFQEESIDEDHPITVCILPAARILAVIAANFTQLTYLKLKKAGGFAFTDENIKDLTEALPLLREFHLIGGFYQPQITHDTTIASLIYLAQNCPMLSDLSLEFDARKDKLPQPATYWARGYKLRCVCVQVSPTDCPELVASILCTVFPNLENVVNGYILYKEEGEEIEDEMYFEPWDIIRELLEVDKEKRLGRVMNSTIKVFRDTRNGEEGGADE